MLDNYSLLSLVVCVGNSNKPENMDEYQMYERFVRTRNEDFFCRDMLGSPRKCNARTVPMVLNNELLLTHET